MPHEERAAALLRDMRDAASAASSFVSGKTFEEYVGDLLLRSGVERQLEIVGEPARHLTRQFREAHPDIPWTAIIVQRHVLAHEYGELQHELVWRVATVHAPKLVEQLDRLIPRIEDGPETKQS